MPARRVRADRPSAGAWLLRQRERRGLSQRDLADLLDRNQGTISRYERGTAVPSDEVAERLAVLWRLDEAVVRQKLGLRVPESRRSDGLILPEGVELTPKQQAALEAVLDAFLDDAEAELRRAGGP